MRPERIKAARKHRGLTQAELARRIGVTQSLIGQYERGLKRPKVESLQSLAGALDVTIPWLLGEEYGNAEPRVPFSKTTEEPLSGLAAILGSYTVASGLRDLARDTKLHTALGITEAEWEALRSLKPPGDLSQEGYLSVLIAIRAALGRDQV